MSKRKQFIDYVKYGGTPICSIQIGAGAGYDSKLTGHDWLSETTMDDTISVCERYDMLPLYNFGLDILAPSDLKWNVIPGENTATKRSFSMEMETPYGTLKQAYIEQPKLGMTRTLEAVRGEEELDAFEWVLDQILEGKHYDRITENVNWANNYIGDRGALDYQWGMQPYELFSYTNTIDNMYLSIDNEERFIRLMDKCLGISEKIVKAVARGGADFCFLGGPAAEMVNPYIYENFMVPYGKRITDAVHNEGMLVYSHVCSPVEPFLTKGYFNQLGIDLFETLSMAPVGNVVSIQDAFTKIDPVMCTRGNVGLDKLIRCTPDEIYLEVEHIMKEAIKANRKHMVAASDYLMYDCKEENVIAMCEAVKSFRR